MNANGYHDRLHLLRSRLLGDIGQIKENALSKDVSTTSRMPTSMAELGTDNSDQELTLDLLGNEQEVLTQIDAALDRIENGTFGTCEGCGHSIGKARLEAIPYTAFCVKCASQKENGGPSR